MPAASLASPIDDGTRGLPDGLDLALEETARALRTWSDAQGWLPPAEGGSGRVLPIAFEELPDGIDALLLLDHEPEQTFEEDATALIVVSRHLLDDSRALTRALIHQAAHAVLWAYSHREPPLWQEASAVALELQATRDAQPYVDLFSERLHSRTRSLLPQRLREAQGAGLWTFFLDVSRPAGSAALRRVWEELAAVPGDNLADALETAMRGPEGQGLGEEIATYLAWGLFTGDRDDGRHFPFAGALRGGVPDALHSEFPASGAGTGIEAWGGSVVRLQTGTEPGGLRVQFQGDEPGRWSVLALFEGRSGGALYSAWLPVDADGRAELRFPWSGLRSATLIVANAASPGSAPARFGYSVWREPSYPFELAGFQAEAEAAGILVSWTTDGERDMAGWNLYRSLSPLTGFVRVNRLPIPAGGEVREPLRYLFLDTEAEPGRKYYYRLEGLTTGGFNEATTTVSARTPGRIRQP